LRSTEAIHGRITGGPDPLTAAITRRVVPPQIRVCGDDDARPESVIYRAIAVVVRAITTLGHRLTGDTPLKRPVQASGAPLAGPNATAHGVHIFIQLAIAIIIDGVTGLTLRAPWRTHSGLPIDAIIYAHHARALATDPITQAFIDPRIAIIIEAITCLEAVRMNRGVFVITVNALTAWISAKAVAISVRDKAGTSRCVEAAIDGHVNDSRCISNARVTRGVTAIERLPRLKACVTTLWRAVGAPRAD
jgi:hypothetical protein